MSCQRALEIDLLGFLDDPRSSEHATFRDHYPRCPWCAAEVRAWSELRQQLAGPASDPEHPAPERLARYAAGSEALTATDRAGLEAHLAACAPCRDELGGLRRFDPARWAAAAPARPAGQRGGASWFGALGRLLWHPAFAYALAGLLLVPAVYRTLRPAVVSEPAPVIAMAERASEPEGVLEGVLASEGREAPAAKAKPATQAPAAERLEHFATGRADAPLGEPPAPEEKPEAEALAQEARDLAGLAAAPAETRKRAAADTVSPAEPTLVLPELRLRAQGTTRVVAGVALAGLRLRLPLRLPDTGPVVVRVVEIQGDREVRQRSFAAPSMATLPLALPPGWLRPGSYRVELRVGSTEAPPRTFRLEVVP